MTPREDSTGPPQGMKSPTWQPWPLHPSPVFLLLAQGELQSGGWAEQTRSQQAPPRIQPARPSPVCVHALCDFSLGRICIWSFVLQSFCFICSVFVSRGWGVQSSRSICIYLFFKIDSQIVHIYSMCCFNMCVYRSEPAPGNPVCHLKHTSLWCKQSESFLLAPLNPHHRNTTEFISLAVT